MKLIYTKTSPYARKVRVLIQELGLKDIIPHEEKSPLDNSDVLLNANPLGKVPVLTTKEGHRVHDSAVICLFLLSEHGNSRYQPLKMDTEDGLRENVADSEANGVMDAAFALTMERNRPIQQQSEFWKERWVSAISRTIATWELDVACRTNPSLADISKACALDYVDFRLPDIEWQGENVKLAQWCAEILSRQSFQNTDPRVIDHQP